MSGPARCTGEPVSWLALERYRLGELPAGQRRAIAAHLDACAACAACLAAAEQERARLPPLPSLAAPATRASSQPSSSPAWSWSRLRGARPGRGWAATGFAGVLAASLAIVALTRPRLPDETLAGRTARGIKGGGVAIALVRERAGAIDHDARTFTAGDRWKVQVTCPAEGVLFWDVAVIEGAAVSFPLSPVAPIACGNHVALPGAFHLDGRGPVEVCLVLGDDPLDRARLATLAGAMPPARAARSACVTLQPAATGPP